MSVVWRQYRGVRLVRGKQAVGNGHVGAERHADEAAVWRAVVALPRHVVPDALDAHVRPAHGDTAGVVYVLRLRLVGDRGEMPALDDKRPGVHGIRPESGNRLVVPYYRRARVHHAGGVREEHLPLGCAVVLIAPVADVLPYVVVLHLHEARAGQFHAEAPLPGCERGDALYVERLP